jgi:RNA polymerase-binding transcription factor DksA
MTSHAIRKTQLEARRAALTARLDGIEAELEAPHSPDWEDLATEREGDEVLERMSRSVGQELRQIDAALARLAGGDYGTCLRCGAEIGAARLDLLPFTPFCRTCAR